MPPRTPTFELPTQKRSRTLLRLGKYMLQYKGRLAFALALTLFANVFLLLGPRLSGYAIDAIIGPGQVIFKTVLYYAGLMVIFFVFSSIFAYVRDVLMIDISRRVIYTVRQDMFNHLSSLPVRFYDTHATGDIISRISYDCDTLNASLSNDLVTVLASIITIGGSLWMMLQIAPMLVLVFAVTVPLSVLITRFITKRTQPLFRRRSKKLGDLNGFVEEMITGQKTLKAYIQEENTIARLDVENAEVAQAYYMAEYYSSINGPTINFVNNLSLTLVSIFGALMYMAGSITVGNISSFVLYSRKFSGPINEIANIYGELMSALAAAERVFRVLDEESEPVDEPDAMTLDHVRGNVALQEVSFGYVPGRTVLQGLNLEADQGKLIAIVGPTGAGKTTIINMLMRFYDIDQGVITVDGNDIRAVTRDSLRLAYSMVLQDTWLFYGSIYDNIAYGKENATREEVEAVAKAVKMHGFITRLPMGYDTILTDDAANISKGQMQLLTIARAMLMDAKMLILDEATSNVDTRTEVQIQQAMRRLMQDKTCFVVAHRLSTIQNADRILVVRDGNVVESGAHSDLMAKKGFYRELYDAQFV